jgi:hypothetical protein
VIRNRTASGVAKLDHEIDSVLGEFSLVPFQINDCDDPGQEIRYGHPNTP